jgi:hypothetical protein
VFNSVIKPTYMLTYESASELLHLNLEEEAELRILYEAAKLRLNWRREQVDISFFFWFTIFFLMYLGFFYIPFDKRLSQIIYNFEQR